MGKRGQATIFIIISILLVVVVLIVVYFSSSKPQISSSNEYSKVRSYILDNINDNSEKAIIILGLQGGYTSDPPRYIDYDIIKISYWNLSNKSYPPLELIQDQISSFVFSQLPNCSEVQNLTKSEVVCGNKTVKTKISEDRVEVDVTYLLSVQGLEAASISQEYKKEIKIGLKDYYNHALFILNNSDCFSCLRNRTLYYNISIKQIESNEYTINMILSNSSQLNDVKGYVFQFAIKK